MKIDVYKKRVGKSRFEGTVHFENGKYKLVIIKNNAIYTTVYEDSIVHINKAWEWWTK